jgi:hypothetical protein
MSLGVTEIVDGNSLLQSYVTFTSINKVLQFSCETLRVYLFTQNNTMFRALCKPRQRKMMAEKIGTLRTTTTAVALT